MAFFIEQLLWLLLNKKRVQFFTINPLSANPTKWSNTLKQFIDKLPMNCLNVFDHFVKLVLKRLSVSLNLMFVHLSAFVYFINIFRYRSKQRTSELSTMATKIVSTMFFFLIKKFFLQNKNLHKFPMFAQSLHSLYFLNSIEVSFHVVVWPVWLIWDNLHLSLHVS